jgi:hypothetical protein
MLGRRVRQHRKSRDALEQLLGRMIAPEFADGRANGGLVTLEERRVQIYFLPFFLAGAFAAALVLDGVAAVAVPVMPSDSERLSSTSTVCVIVSLPFGAGCASAGAIVCVVGWDAAPLLWRAQPAQTTAASRRGSRRFTRRNTMQFP